MKILRSMYDWTLSLAARKAAEVWLGVIAFVESSFFLVPADVLFLPMCLSRPSRAMRYALVATVCSVLGGIGGYYIGFYGYEAIGKPMLDAIGKLDTFEKLRGDASGNAILIMLITSGLSHLPPIKVVTILSGVVAVNIWVFIISCILARGARFFIFAWLLQRYGEPIKDFIDKRFGILSLIGVAVICLLIFAVTRL
jgi:membrane protein YqaA with SNARE-associated domain